MTDEVNLSMRVNALWWWIDRWRKSTAFMDMTLEQQGAYRNLLDAAALRGGVLPINQKVLANACGDPRRWSRVRDAVLGHFILTPEGYRNQTLDEVMSRSREVSEQRAAAGKAGNARRWHRKPHRKTIANGIANASQMASLYNLSINPYSPLEKGTSPRVTKRELREAAEIRSRAYGGCPHDPACATHDACIRLIATHRKGHAV